MSTMDPAGEARAKKETMKATVPSTEDDKANISSRWFEDPKYRHYWKHYKTVQDWFTRHYAIVHGLNNMSISHQEQQWHSSMLSAMAQLSHYYYSISQYYGQFADAREQPTSNARKPHNECGSKAEQSIGHIFKTPAVPAKNHTNNIKRKNSAKKKKHKRRRRNAAHSLSGHSDSSEANGSKLNDSFEMEITDDMMEFFAKSAEHKKEMAHLKKLKKAEEKENGDYVNLNEVSSKKRTGEAPTERPGVRRTAEMKLLYGQGAAMIHGMETAMQLTYDRHFDIRQPKPWPNLPLNIKF